MIAFFESLTVFQFVLIANYILVVFAVVGLLLKHANPTKTISYILVLVTVPVLGLIVYYLFGQEFRKQKIFNRKHILNQATVVKYNKAYALDEEVLEKLEEDFLDHKVKLIRLLNSTKEAPLTRCNEIEVVRNGENIIPKILADIRAAEKFVHLEYYIIEDDETGSELINVLCEKASQGVSVKLVYDYVGSSIASSLLNKMDDNGIEVFPFMPVYFPRFTSKLNYRDHRKIAIIDGKIGYVGGVNIANTYYNGRNKTYWRDTHLRITGQAVGSLHMHFFMTWDFVSENEFSVESVHFPKCETQNRAAVQIAASGPDTDWANIMEAIFTAINLAEKYVYITTPYLIPNDEIITALLVAAKSGVDVRVIVPEKSDSWAAQYAGASYYARLLEGGVKVCLYQKGFVHAKTMVVDDSFATVGTSNMDYRSFNINFEINALMYDKETAATLLAHFNEDLKDCRELEFDEWDSRSFGQRIKESFFRLLAPLL